MAEITTRAHGEARRQQPAHRDAGRPLAKVFQLADYRKSTKAARPESAAEKLRRMDEAFTAIAFHLVSAARIISAINSSGVSS